MLLFSTPPPGTRRGLQGLQDEARVRDQAVTMIVSIQINFHDSIDDGIRGFMQAVRKDRAATEAERWLQEMRDPDAEDVDGNLRRVLDTVLGWGP